MAARSCCVCSVGSHFQGWLPSAAAVTAHTLRTPAKRNWRDIGTSPGVAEISSAKERVAKPEVPFQTWRGGGLHSTELRAEIEFHDSVGDAVASYQHDRICRGAWAPRQFALALGGQ